MSNAALEALLEPTHLSHYRALILVTDHAALRQQLRERLPEAHYSHKLGFFKFPSDACLYLNHIPSSENSLYRYAGMAFHRIMVEGEFIYHWYQEYLAARVFQTRGRNPLDHKQEINLQFWLNGRDVLQRL